jgi:hypothetical protein
MIIWLYLFNKKNSINMIGFWQKNCHLMRKKMRSCHGDFVFKMKMQLIILFFK